VAQLILRKEDFSTAFKYGVVMDAEENLETKDEKRLI